MTWDNGRSYPPQHSQARAGVNQKTVISDDICIPHWLITSRPMKRLIDVVARSADDGRKAEIAR